VKDEGTPREAIQGWDRFFQFYNRQRPHQALGYRTPSGGVFRFVLIADYLNFRLKLS
jgi:integrase-like protein